MPFDPKAVGKNLISIGDKELVTGQKLDSAARKLGQIAELLKAKGKVDKSMVSIEAGTRSTHNLLAPVGVAVHFVANKLDDVTVPDLDFQSTTIDVPVVGKIKVLTGVSVSAKRPFRDIATRITKVAEDIDNIAEALDDVANGLRDIHAELPNIRTSLLEGSQDAKDGAKSLIDAGTLMKNTGTLLTT